MPASRPHAFSVSSSSSLASSPSSFSSSSSSSSEKASATPSAVPIRRITLTIPALRQKPQPVNSPRASGLKHYTPSVSVLTNKDVLGAKLSSAEAEGGQAQGEKAKIYPKIKIKPLRPAASISNDSQKQSEEKLPAQAEEPNFTPTPVQAVENMQHVPLPSAPASPVPPEPPIQKLPQSTRPARASLPPKPKVTRPIKLKPLKEILTKLIHQIKKKDDYAFFLHPVNESQVPGYSDIVKDPMDFGTVTEKVAKGQYRSLEQFKDDFLLVTSNAKAFNPSDTLYHTEAAKIEAWGLDHINRASAHVIEYEADWTIDVIADENPMPPPEASAETSGAGVYMEGSSIVPSIAPDEDSGSLVGTSRARSPSVLSSAQGGMPPTERAKRGSRMKKGVPTSVSESWEEGGHLPGYKDGLSAFPPESDFAALMLELKLKGKRFRTKKERLKREKEGPPLAADGSLDYADMEHPFTVLRRLVPDSLTIPQLTPLIATRSVQLSSEESAPLSAGTHQPSSSTPQPQLASVPPADSKLDEKPIEPAPAPLSQDGPIAFPPDALHSILVDYGKNGFTNIPTAMAQVGDKKLRHWTILRNPPRTAFTRVRDDDDAMDGAQAGSQSQQQQQGWKRRRVEPTDYGAYASLVGALAAESGLKAEEFEDAFGSNEKLMERIRTSVEKNDSQIAALSKADDDGDDERGELLDADDYIRDVVYGGVDGLAYFRSLAEFVGGSREFEGTDSDERTSAGLGMPLAKWVEGNIVDKLTYGRHAILCQAVNALTEWSESSHEITSNGDNNRDNNDCEQQETSSEPSTPPIPAPPSSDKDGDAQDCYSDKLIEHYLALARADKSEMRAKVRELKELADPEAKIDIAPLLKVPEELFFAESEWSGSRVGLGDSEGESESARAGAVANAAGEAASGGDGSINAVSLVQIPAQTVGLVSNAGTDAGASATTTVGALLGWQKQMQMQGAPMLLPNAAATAAVNPYAHQYAYQYQHSPDAIEHALLSSAKALCDLGERLQKRQQYQGSLRKDEDEEEEDIRMDEDPNDPDVKAAAGDATSEKGKEGALTRKTRLMLIALAKRAPLDRIARLPPELVPLHIRHIVPTLGS